MQQIRKFFKLQPSDQWLLIKVYFLLMTIKIGLNVLSFHDLRRLINRWTIPVSTPVDDPFEMHKVVKAIEIGSRYTPGRSTCLVKALTGHILLTRRNIPVDLYIGVRRESKGELGAHAWVSNQGQVIIGDMENLDVYVPLTSPSMKVV